MNNFISLENICLELVKNPRKIAFRKEHLLSSEDFLSFVGGLVEKIQSSKNSAFILCCQDSFAFAVGFFALAHSAKKICLPPNTHEGNIQKFDSTFGLISDLDFSNAIGPLAYSANWQPTKLNLKNKISFYTSGSTGESKEVKKILQQLNDECFSLENHWGIGTMQKHVISSVSHQHLYGMLFKVLWPMCSGRLFSTETSIYENALSADFRRYPEALLVSCPAHLDAACGFTDLHIFKNRLIFSSTAPLSVETAEYIYELARKSPYEIFGSTETGGIAWKCQDRDHDWHLFDGVDVKKDDKSLTLKSPSTSEKWLTSGDKVAWLGKRRFQHLGREDRIVKISGKRLSLDEMEKSLQKSEFVDSAKIIIVTTSPHFRQSAGAAICLTSEGETLLNEKGKLALNQTLKHHLKSFFDHVQIPKFWRYINSFPVNPMGKTPKDLLSLLFENSTKEYLRFPQILSLNHSENSLEMQFFLSADLDFFQGHFEEFPLLPGVAQIFWVTHYASEILGLCGVRKISQLKFNKIMRPATDIVLQIAQKDKILEFKYVLKDKIYSQGKIFYS